MAPAWTRHSAPLPRSSSAPPPLRWPPPTSSRAAGLLARGLVALGPAEDGGYTLLGLPAPAPFLFTDMAWSTAAVLPETVRRLEARAIPYGLLPVLPDLDRPEDLARFPDLHR